MKNPITVGLWQCTAAPLDVAGNLRRLDQTAQQASQLGAAVLVCPEMFLTGYNIGRSAVLQLAQAADGSNANAVAGIALRHSIALVYGYPELDRQGLVFNAAQWVSASGECLLNYRKTALFGALDRSQFSPGEAGSALVELHGWRIGMLICYDIEFPEHARRLALAGADLIVVPTANMAGYDFVARSLVPVRAYENQVYVAYANYVGSEGALQYGGLSTLAAPDGIVLASAGRDEALITATLDGPRLDAARQANTHLQECRGQGPARFGQAPST